MNFISIVVVIFSMLAAADRIFGGKLGLSKEFEKGFMLLGTMALSMIGMIVISPFIADVLSPCFDFVYKAFGIDPSVIPAILFANDMGGAPLAKEVAQNADIGMFNALVVSSMMGATISFTIPLSLGMVKNEHSENTTAFFKMYGTEYDAEDDTHEAEITISQKTYFYVDGHYITICTNTNDFADVPVDKIVLNTDHDTNFNRIISAEIAVECGFDQKPYRLFTTDGTTYPISGPGIQSASYVVIIGRYYKL